MDAWTGLTVAVVLNAMPTDMATLYASWVDANPSKVDRLQEIISEVLGTFRQAVASNPACELNDDETTVPVSGLRHALNSVFHTLGMEMGMQFSVEVSSLLTRADIWVRMVAAGEINPLGEDAGAGTPSYVAPDLTGVIL